MNTCIFCKIITGEIPAIKLYEDENTLAFLDANPVNLGHTLVVPKTHTENVFDTPPETIAVIAQTGQKIAQAIKTSGLAESVNLIANNGAPAGQLIFHTHLHVIPRHEGDGYEHWHGPERSEEEKRAAGKQIQEAL